MSALAYVNGIVIPAAAKMLPSSMDVPAARVMLLAIGLQESRMTYRRQIGGPARSFLQFETAGVKGVMKHQASSGHAATVLRAMGYGETTLIVHEAIENNDILAFVFGRLLLWTHSKPLPVRADPDGAWNYYTATWRPGKPHRATWDAFYEQAWDLTSGTT